MDKRVGLTFVLALTLGLPACGGGGSPAESGAAVKSPAKTTASKAAEPAKPKKPKNSGICAEKSNGQTCAFGQPAAFTVTAGQGPSRPVEITVAPPIPFIPTDAADAAAATQAENVEFSITIKNLSGTLWENTTVTTEVSSAGASGAAISTYAFQGLDVPPRESVTVQEAWSVKDAGDIKLTLDLEGQAGHSITFTR